jgi:HEPN domain-containing protein
MINIQKQIDYWRNGATEELECAANLFEDGRIRHGLFFLHLAIEKILKAHVCRKTQDLAPWKHNLLRLSDLADIKLKEEDAGFLVELNQYNLEGRYPEMSEELPSAEDIKQIRQTTERIFVWLHDQL